MQAAVTLFQLAADGSVLDQSHTPPAAIGDSGHKTQVHSTVPLHADATHLRWTFYLPRAPAEGGVGGGSSSFFIDGAFVAAATAG